MPAHGDLISNIKNCQMFYFRSMQCPDEETNALRRLWIHNKHWKMKEKENYKWWDFLPLCWQIEGEDVQTWILHHPDNPEPGKTLNLPQLFLSLVF